MFRRKLGRFTGLVLALAVAFGGIAGVAGGHPTASAGSPMTATVLEWD
ncbi:hypothetical protein [Actinoplanes solisilvae]|nr:hypothetical protein [Actinoplanes solisilvae]